MLLASAPAAASFFLASAYLLFFTHRTGAIAMRHQHHTARSISITANNMFNTYT
jgi:hypothetical protein